LDAFERNGVKRFSQYLDAVAHAAEHGAQFAWAGALTVKGVVDQIDQGWR
jgi:hypothetical protein